MGNETRKYNEKRNLISYNDVINKTGETQIICIDSGVLSIVRQFLGTRALWRTSYYTGLDVSVYTIPDSTEFNIIDELIGEFLSEVNNMATCNDLQTSIQALTSVLSSGSFGGNCGCGSAGATGEPGVTTDIGDRGLDNGTLPDGFADWTEFELYACDVATYIINQLYGDMNRLEAFNLTSAVLAAVTAAILTPIPFDDVVLMFGLMVAMLSEGTYATILAGIKDAINNNTSSLVCALFEASNEAQAEADLQAAMEVAIDGELAEPLATVAGLFVNYWINADNLNKLFQMDEVLIASGDLPTGDCSSCNVGCAEPFTVQEGTHISGGTFETNTASDATYNKENLRVRFETDGGLPCGTVTITSMTKTGGAWSHSWPGYTFELVDENNQVIYESDNEPNWPISGVSRVWIRSWEYKPSVPDKLQVTFNWTVD